MRRKTRNAAVKNRQRKKEIPLAKPHSLAVPSFSVVLLAIVALSRRRDVCFVCLLGLGLPPGDCHDISAMTCATFLVMPHVS